MREGTWVLLVELGGRPPDRLEGVPDLGIPPPFPPAGPRREGGEADHGLRVETAALPVPGREDCTLCLFVEVRWAGVAWEAASLPSSEAMSVMREEMMLGGPWEGGGWSRGGEDMARVGGWVWNCGW